MNYNLLDKDDRKRFVARANTLLAKQRSNVCLIDESNRTVNQNSYIHVLCRILAADTGQTTEYAKQVYFKELANPDIFVSITKDPITNQMVKYTRSTTTLSITEMRKAIDNFRKWASDNGYYLPDANLQDDGSMIFSSTTDKDAYNQAIIETSKVDDFL